MNIEVHIPDSVLEKLADLIASRVTDPKPSNVVPIQPAPVAETPATQPITQEELQAINAEFGQIATAMNDGGQAIFGVLAQHGIKQLSEVGDNRALLDTIVSQVRNLQSGSAA